MKKINFSSCRIAAALTGVIAPPITVVVITLLDGHYSLHGVYVLAITLIVFLLCLLVCNERGAPLRTRFCIIRDCPITCWWLVGVLAGILLLSVAPSSSVRREHVVKWWHEVAQTESIDVEQEGR